MEIHFYDAESIISRDTDEYFGWVDTIRAVNNKVEKIHTTQLGLLSTDLFKHGYRILIHPYDSKSFEIKLGNNECTNREIRMEHNLFKLWKNGEF